MVIVTIVTFFNATVKRDTNIVAETKTTFLFFSYVCEYICFRLLLKIQTDLRFCLFVNFTKLSILFTNDLLICSLIPILTTISLHKVRPSTIGYDGKTVAYMHRNTGNSRGDMTKILDKIFSDRQMFLNLFTKP